MKRIIFTFFALISISIFGSCETQATKTRVLLLQAKEKELHSLYDEIQDYIRKDENYYFDKDKGDFFLKTESADYILGSFYNFHKENHIPLLTDKEHPENWDNWFYYYKQVLNPSELSEGKFNKYNNELSTRCEFCRIAYEENIDITWPKIKYTLLNEHFLSNYMASKRGNLLIAKQKADAEEAERKRIEATRVKGILGCEFGMSMSTVQKKLQSKGIENWNGGKTAMASLVDEPKFAECLFAKNCSYGGIKFGTVGFLFINNSLYKIFLVYDGLMSAYIDSYLGTNDTNKEVAKFRALINDIILKYEFNNKPISGTFHINDEITYGKIYKKDDGTEMFTAIENGHSFMLSYTNNKIKNENYTKALQKSKESASKRTDF